MGVASMGKKRSHTQFWWGDLEYLGMAGKIILKWTCKKEDRRAHNGLILFRIGTSGGLL